jgi:hypothetical protein
MPAIPFGASFGDQAPLNGDVFIVVKGHHLIAAPAGRHMVQDNVLMIPATYGIGFKRGVCPYADISDDHVVGAHAKTSPNANAVSWGGLPGDGDVVIPDAKISFNGA